MLTYNSLCAELCFSTDGPSSRIPTKIVIISTSCFLETSILMIFIPPLLSPKFLIAIKTLFTETCDIVEEGVFGLQQSSFLTIAAFWRIFVLDWWLIKCCWLMNALTLTLHWCQWSFHVIAWQETYGDCPTSVFCCIIVYSLLILAYSLFYICTILSD